LFSLVDCELKYTAGAKSENIKLKCFMTLFSKNKNEFFGNTLATVGIPLRKNKSGNYSPES